MQWVAPSKCSKRDAEVQHNMKNDSKSVLQLEKDALVVTPKDHATADVSNELRLQWALQRRGIAFDQCFLVSWHVHQAWVTLLMETMSEELPPGYVQVSAAQALRADKELWTLASKASAGSFIADSAGKSPCDQLVKDHMRHPKIARMLLPLPKGLASHANSAGIKDAELDNQAPKCTPKKTKKNPRKRPAGAKPALLPLTFCVATPDPSSASKFPQAHRRAFARQGAACVEGLLSVVGSAASSGFRVVTSLLGRFFGAASSGPEPRSCFKVSLLSCWRTCFSLIHFLLCCIEPLLISHVQALPKKNLTV